MARIFLDTNIYIDVLKRSKEKWQSLDSSLIFISPLSTHILYYTFKLQVPNREIDNLRQYFGVVPLTEEILNRSLEGPTTDLEDNIQLHSAVEADCDLFLTADKNLLKLKFFGKLKIQETF